MGARVRWAAVCGMACVIALLIVSGAGATSNTTIGFDDLTNSAVVTDQYASQGVLLGTRAALGATFLPASGDCTGPTVVADQTTAFSAPNYARLSDCAQVGAQAFAGTYGKVTTYLRSSVSVEVRLMRGIASDLRGPSGLSLAVSRKLGPGSYTVVLRRGRTTVTRRVALR